MNFSTSLLSLLGLSSFIPTLTSAQGGGMNITAISAVNGASVLECWSLAAPPKNFAGASNYPIGNFENAFVGVIPPKTYIGFAHAPSVQFSLVMSGLVHISLPNSTSEAWIQGGKYGFILAADTVNVSSKGHITEFPSAADTVIAQFPAVGGVVPEHVVLYERACGLGELVGM